MEDNLYIVRLRPDEFHELLTDYENSVEWRGKSMTDEQRALSSRVLEKLHQADFAHVCVDEEEGEAT